MLIYGYERGFVMSPNDDLINSQIYENTSKFREMTAVQFCEYMGIELLPYQKLMLNVLEKINECVKFV